MYTAKTTTTTMFILMLKGVKYACKYKHLLFLCHHHQHLHVLYYSFHSKLNSFLLRINISLININLIQLTPTSNSSILSLIDTQDVYSIPGSQLSSLFRIFILNKTGLVYKKEQ